MSSRRDLPHTLGAKYCAAPRGRNADGERAVSGGGLPAGSRLSRRDCCPACCRVRSADGSQARARRCAGRLREARADAAGLARRYEPELLAAYRLGDVWCSSLLEYLGCWSMASGSACRCRERPLNEALATTRLLFGAEAIEYRTADRDARRRDPRHQGVPDAHAWSGCSTACCPRRFRSCSRSRSPSCPRRPARPCCSGSSTAWRNAGDFAVSQAAELKDALDALTSNEFVMGDHHFSLQVLADVIERGRRARRPAAASPERSRRARARLLADTGMTVAREDLALEAAFWAQLPGNFAHAPAQGADHLAQLRRDGALPQLSRRAVPPAITGARRWRCCRPARARRTTSRCTRATRPTRTAAAARIPGTPSSADPRARARRCSSAFWWRCCSGRARRRSCSTRTAGSRFWCALSVASICRCRTGAARASTRCSCRRRPSTSSF